MGSFDHPSSCANKISVERGMSHAKFPVLTFNSKSLEQDNFPSVSYYQKTLSNDDGPSIELTVQDAMGKPSTNKMWNPLNDSVLSP